MANWLMYLTIWKWVADIMLFYCHILEHAPRNKKFHNHKCHLIDLCMSVYVLCTRAYVLYISNTGTRVYPGDDHESETKPNLLSYVDYFLQQKWRLHWIWVRADMIFIAIIPGQHPSKCLQKHEFAFTTRLPEIRRLSVLVGMGLFPKTPSLRQCLC